jgi:hypothetical protein
LPHSIREPPHTTSIRLKNQTQQQDLFRKTNLPLIIGTVRNAGDLGRYNVLVYCESTKIRAIFSFEMRPLFAILSLLSLIAARADDLPVIKNSEAAQLTKVQI